MAKRILFLLLSIFMVVNCSQFNLDILQSIRCTSEQFICVYDGTCCRAGEEECNSLTRTCVPSFPSGMSEQDKLRNCCGELRRNDSANIGLHLTCLLRYGKLSWMERCDAVNRTTSTFDLVVSKLSTAALIICLLQTPISLSVIIYLWFRYRAAKRKTQQIDCLPARENYENLLSEQRAHFQLQEKQDCQLQEIKTSLGMGSEIERSPLLQDSHVVPLNQPVENLSSCRPEGLQIHTYSHSAAANAANSGTQMRRTEGNAQEIPYDPAQYEQHQVVHPAVSESEKLRAIHMDQSTPHEGPESLAPSGRPHRDLLVHN